jgi:hypothetical protein
MAIHACSHNNKTLFAINKHQDQWRAQSHKKSLGKCVHYKLEHIFRHLFPRSSKTNLHLYTDHDHLLANQNCKTVLTLSQITTQQENLTFSYREIIVFLDVNDPAVVQRNFSISDFYLTFMIATMGNNELSTKGKGATLWESWGCPQYSTDWLQRKSKAWQFWSQYSSHKINSPLPIQVAWNNIRTLESGCHQSNYNCEPFISNSCKPPFCTLLKKSGITFSSNMQ